MKDAASRIIVDINCLFGKFDSNYLCSGSVFRLDLAGPCSDDCLQHPGKGMCMYYMIMFVDQINNMTLTLWKRGFRYYKSKMQQI